MAHTPIWKDIAETLAAEIAARHFPTGGKLPTEAELATRFGVNRHTVRHALAELAERGLVHSRRGAGVFVVGQPTSYPIGRRVRFHQAISEAGKTAQRVITLLETRMSDAEEAEQLQLDNGAHVHIVEGMSLVDDQPLGVFRSVFPADRFPGLLELTEIEKSVTLVLAKFGVKDYTRAWTHLTAVAAKPVVALQLKLKENAPLLRSVSLNVDPAGLPVEYGITWFAGERITLTVTPEA